MLPDLYFIINYSVGLFASILAVIMGVLTIFIIIIDKQCHNVTNLLACNTCIAVISYSIMASVTSIYGFREDWAFNAPLCAFRAYCFLASVGILCYSYSIQAISRLFFAIFYKHKNLQTYRTHCIMIFINWFLGFTVTIPPFFIKGSYGLEKESRACIISSKVSSSSFYAGAVISLIPLNTVTIVYGIILYRVRQSGKRVTGNAPSVIRSVPGNNVATPNMKREAKIMHQMSINSSILSGGGFLMFFLIVWYAVRKQPAPEPMYLLGFNSITICAAVMTIAQFIMNDKVKNFAVKYIRSSRLTNIHPSRLPNIQSTTSQRTQRTK